MTIAFVILFCYLSVARGETNPYIEALRDNPWNSVQQYVEVRPGAYLFYWLYYADGTSAGADRKPLIIWIQGGPGLAASGVANFAELGPLDTDMRPRNHTWVKGRNVLLIDHPVGTGFSYATDQSLYAKSDRQIAIDLSRAIKTFFRRHKEFRKTPTYMFGQSYGGKIVTRLGYYLYTAIENKSLKINFKGIGIGGGWVHPRESIPVQPKLLYLMGVIDRNTYRKAMHLTKKTCALIDKNEYWKAHQTYSVIFDIMRDEAGVDFNFNNINQKDWYAPLLRLDIKVNRYVKPTLSRVVNQSIDWKFISQEVWVQLDSNFLVPSTKFLELLLNNTKLKVAIYNGNLDVVTPLAGASNWAHKLNWHGQTEFEYAKKHKIRGDRNGFYKQAKQLSFWWVYGAGHWVPEDNPVAMEQILENIMSEDAL